MLEGAISPYSPPIHPSTSKHPAVNQINRPVVFSASSVPSITTHKPPSFNVLIAVGAVESTLPN